MPKEIKSNLVKGETIDLLHKFQILRDLSRDEIRLLVGAEQDAYQQRISRLIQYKANEMIVQEGDFDSWVYWVVKGKFAVIKDRVIIAIFSHPGEVFGEMSVLEGDRRSASVAALEDGVCLSVDMSVLDHLNAEAIGPKIIRGIQRLKSERLNITTNKLVAQKHRIQQQQMELESGWERLREKELELAKKERALLALEMKLSEKKRNAK